MADMEQDLTDEDGLEERERHFDPTEPIFQEPPERLDEDWYHGFLIGGMALYPESIDGKIMLARSFKEAGDSLVTKALADADLSYEMAYPIMFLYRHAIELYLKLAVPSAKPNHKLPSLIADLDRLVHNRFRQALPQWVKDRLKEFHEIDPNSTSFRYGDVLHKNSFAGGEWWVEFGRVRQTVSLIAAGFERIAYGP